MSSLRLHQLNDVKLVGRLTRDPELRFTGKGQPVCQFNLAVNRRYKDASGEWRDDVSFIPVVAWGELAQRCGERLKKGSPVYVEGRLKSSSWETKDGQKRTGLDVVTQRVQFLAKVEGEHEEPEPASAPAASQSAAPEAAAEDGEEIPF
jgi:single-strand DNA-binding protein